MSGFGKFRQFVKDDDFRYRLREELAAPPSGVPESPSNPSSGGNSHHFDMTKQALGINDEEFTAAIESDSMTLFAPPTYAQTWGYQCTRPVQSTIEELDNGAYKVTFQFEQMPQGRHGAFAYPYVEPDKPTNYPGTVKNQTVTMTAEELQNAMAKPLEGGGMAAGGGGDPMGGGMGAPPMGGGM